MPPLFECFYRTTIIGNRQSAMNLGGARSYINFKIREAFHVSRFTFAVSRFTTHRDILAQNASGK
jgi:hypothetical protein